MRTPTFTDQLAHELKHYCENTDPEEFEPSSISLEDFRGMQKLYAFHLRRGTKEKNACAGIAAETRMHLMLRGFPLLGGSTLLTCKQGERIEVVEGLDFYFPDTLHNVQVKLSDGKRPRRCIELDAAISTESGDAVTFFDASTHPGSKAREDNLFRIPRKFAQEHQIEFGKIHVQFIGNPDIQLRIEKGNIFRLQMANPWLGVISEIKFALCKALKAEGEEARQYEEFQNSLKVYRKKGNLMRINHGFA